MLDSNETYQPEIQTKTVYDVSIEEFIGLTSEEISKLADIFDIEIDQILNIQDLIRKEKK